MNWDGRAVLWKGVPCHQTLDDLWNYQALVWNVKPPVLVEVGPGEGGTALFLRDLGVCPVLSVDKGDPVPEVEGAVVLLDGDVYRKESILADLRIYAPMANWLVVCHTVRDDWGSWSALTAWFPTNKDFDTFIPRRPTRHTWLRRAR